MTRLLIGFECFAALSVLMLLAEPQSGTLVKAEKGQITIKSLEGKEISFDLAEKCMVLINNQPGKLEMLAPGDDITLTIEEKDGAKKVTTIDAKSRKQEQSHSEAAGGPYARRPASFNSAR